MADIELWNRCNQALIAKIIGECAYEECWTPVALANGGFELTLADQYRYEFQAQTTIWGWLLIKPESIICDGLPVSSATQFLVHGQQALGLSNIDLANLLEEIQNTLYSTYHQQLRLSNYSAAEMIQLNSGDLQSLLDGHPKFIANKGRMGWGAEELAWYAPESGERVRLTLVLVRRGLCDIGFSQEAAPWKVVSELVTPRKLAIISELVRQQGAELDDYLPVPVHPWQWQRYIEPQYQAWIQAGDLISAGELEDDYLPQQSLRTFFNLGSVGGHAPVAKYDIKLPLTILNTSCYRGIPGQHIATGADLSQWLFELVAADPLLSAKGMIVQREVCGIHCPHPVQQQIGDAPYRYHEMLGVVWRESLQQYLEGDQQGILMATLMQCDSEGNALIAEYIRQSGIPTEDWLAQLFNTVIVPLYHLMAKYGVGLVSHGQNISVVLEHGLPVRVAIKDFHGDLRIVDQAFEELASMPATVRERLTCLPPHYLIHDLITGHFVTTLRFISPLVETQCGVTETRFYQLLAMALKRYQNLNSDLAERFALFELFDETILKVCINRVRFRIGYGDTTERPVPELGTPIHNPLLTEYVMENNYDKAS